MSNLAILDEDSGEVLQRVNDIAIYIHQLAMDSHGDLYTAFNQLAHTESVLGAKRLAFDALVGKMKPPVSEDTVDIKCNESHAGERICGRFIAHMIPARKRS